MTDVVPLGPDRLRAVLDVDTWAFPSPHDLDDLVSWPQPLPWGRVYGIEDPTHPGQLAACHASYAFSHTPVPGGRLPIAGLTWVAVHPQFRRQGFARAMVTAHLAHCRALGEPVSMLFAAEPAIYGRFGYGLAARQVTLTVPRGAALKPIAEEGLSVRIEHFEFESHGALVARLHGAVDRPGWVTRPNEQHERSFLSEMPMRKGDFETLRILVVERDGEPVGYALFRRKFAWGASGPAGTTRVVEVAAEEPSVLHAAWSRLLDFDLTTEVITPNLAADDPLLNMLVDVRAATPRTQDNLWVRLVDVRAALAGRRYQTDLEVVLDVADTDLPDNAGRWLVRSSGGEVVVERTDHRADLALDVQELGAVYLGGISLAELAAAGLVVEHTPGAVVRTSVAFGWHRAPVANWVF
ncbi:MAG: GNAT family N-acetyltransferase [Propionibacteriaceae bacterium]